MKKKKLITREDALAELESIAGYLFVSDETMDNPFDEPCEWSWDEQHELALRLGDIAYVLRRSLAPANIDAARARQMREGA